jgi:hypothetical protein
MVNEDMEALAKITKGRNYRARRKSSLLRMSGRRVSDAGMMEDFLHRLSITDPELAAGIHEDIDVEDKK